MDIKYMKAALKEAEKAYKIGEVPIGAVVVYGDKIIARGYNTMEKDFDPTGHAEIKAIRKACKKLNNWRLNGCDLYVTTDPCQMCEGAIKLSRLDNIYVGTRDGILADECREIIQNFFKELRVRDKKSEDL